MFLHQAAYLDQNLYRARYPRQMYRGWKIPPRDERYVNTHIRPAYCWYWGGEQWKCYLLMRLDFWAAVASALQVALESALESAVCLGWAKVHLFLCVPSVCADSLRAFWHGRHLSVWFWRSIAGCHSVAAFTLVCRGNSTPCFFSSQTSVQGLLIRYCDPFIAARENHSLGILAMFKARHMSDCSSCTPPHCLAIVADMLNTYTKLVAASNDEMRLLPQPYTLP